MGLLLYSVLPLAFKKVFIIKYLIKTLIVRERERERAKPKSKPITNSTQTQSNTQEQDPLYCSCCATQIPSTYYYYKPQPQDKFCSNDCLTNYHGENCDNCQQKFLKEELFSEKEYPSLKYCLNCWEKLLQEEEQKKLEATKYCKFCGIQLEEKKDFLGVCLKEECLRKFWGMEEKENPEIELEKKLVQGKEEGEKTLNRINQLQDSINQNNEKLIQAQAEKERIEREIEENRKSKVLMGVGVGVIGVVAIGMVWLIGRRKREE